MKPSPPGASGGKPPRGPTKTGDVRLTGDTLGWVPGEAWVQAERSGEGVTDVEGDPLAQPTSAAVAIPNPSSQRISDIPGSGDYNSAGTRRRAVAVVVLSVLGVFALSFFLSGFRHQLAPDLFADELIYADAGRSIAVGGGLTVQGDPFFWQPPLLFILEAPIVWMAHLVDLSTLSLALGMRLLNAGLSGITAATLLLLGWRLRNRWTGLAIALLYATDPFVLRVTRRLFLEPLAGLLVLLALWICLDSSGRWSWPRRAAAGVLFGAAVLAKELVLFSLLVVLLLWLRRQLSRKDALGIIGVAALTYAPYPLWAAQQGLWAHYWSLKYFQLQRLVGVVRITGLTRPGVSIVSSLLDNAAQYWTSYLVILVAAAGTVWLWSRKDWNSRFLSSWSAVAFVFLAGLGKFGTLNDQFFYYLIVPALVVFGYVVSQAVYGASTDRARGGRGWGQRVGLGLPVALIGVVLLANTLSWTQRFALELDDGWVRIVSAIDQTVPAGSTIDVPGASLEILHFAYPHDEYRLLRTTDLALLQRRAVHWYVLSSKDPSLNNGIDQETYDKITRHGVKRWSTQERTFLELGLWEVDDPAALSRLGA